MELYSGQECHVCYAYFQSVRCRYRSLQLTLLGVDGIIANTASLYVLFNSIVDRAKHPEGTIQFQYILIEEEAVVSGIK